VRARQRRYQTATGRESTYPTPETVQTNPAGSKLHKAAWNNAYLLKLIAQI
jgi:hypothetical protein